MALRVFLIVCLVASVGVSAQDPQLALTQKALLHCQATLYPILARQADGQLVDATAAMKAFKAQFEIQNPGKTVDATLTAVDLPPSQNGK